ncbi:response regulator [Natronorubrum sp. JWXQ-INN-674]|uniref:Response regulator n=1 Tax=Natronorubrum halalkaliphilum TaxID=2691917 RepID=A0A6B0VQC1_9EURY|nr:response regulator [Natronorubrum halalkaliphilum]MXV63363.1 response regulator [Natronorubrum halalkaliphilum]
MSNLSSRALDLLIVEDNPGDARLVQEAFGEPDDASSLHVVSDGDEALDFVHQRGDHAAAPRPDLILLDWNIPRTSGKAVLTELKGDPDLKQIPVTVLTGSQDESDIVTSYTNHANACLTKAVEPGEFMDTLETFKKFWLSTAQLPTTEEER